MKIQIIGGKGIKAGCCQQTFEYKKFVDDAQQCFAFIIPPIIQIFTEGEGDGIKSRLPFNIFSTLHCEKKNCQTFKNMLTDVYARSSNNFSFENLFE